MITSIEGVYADALTRLASKSKAQSDLARELFVWVSHLLPPLSFDELQEALAINDKGVNQSRLRSPKKILDVCMGLVVLEQENNTVRLCHYTLGPFL